MLRNKTMITSINIHTHTHTHTCNNFFSHHAHAHNISLLLPLDWTSLCSIFALALIVFVLQIYVGVDLSLGPASCWATQPIWVSRVSFIHVFFSLHVVLCLFLPFSISHQLSCRSVTLIMLVPAHVFEHIVLFSDLSSLSLLFLFLFFSIFALLFSSLLFSHFLFSLLSLLSSVFFLFFFSFLSPFSLPVFLSS